MNINKIKDESLPDKSSDVELRTTLFLFDVDGTMTNTTEVDKHCFNETMAELYDFGLSDINWSEFKHVTDTGLCQELYFKKKGRKISKTQLIRVQRLFIKKINAAVKNQPHRFQAVPGISNFLKDINARGIPTAIATGGWRKSAEAKLNAANIEYEPFTLATSNDSFKRRTIMNVAIARSQFEFQRKFTKIIYFGDGLWDATTCKAMNIPMIGIDCQGTNRLNNTSVYHVFPDFKDIDGLYDVVKKIVLSHE